MKFFPFLLILLLPATVWGQEIHVAGTPDNETNVKKHHDHSVNFGVKGGFTSSLFLVSNLTIDGVHIKEVQNNYKIGYFSSIFMRINFDRHFLQPEISYNINRCNIAFNRTETSTDQIPNESSITSSIHSIDIPVIYGYNIIKQGPYSLAIFGGPKLRYIWNKKSKVTFENFSQQGIHEKLLPLNASLTLGVAVTISRIFFDFRYDIGLHNISREVTYDQPDADSESLTTTDTSNEIRFHRRDNVLSFSLGVFF